MRSVAAVFALVVVLNRGAVGQDSKPEKPVATFSGHATGVNTLAFSPDGRQVVSVCSKDVRTWESSSGRELGALNGMGGEVVALSPDGKSLAVAGRQKVTILDTTSGKEQLSIDPHGDWDRTFPFRPQIAAVAFSPDGGRFATAGSVTRVGGPHGYPGGVVAIWDAKSGKILHRFDRLSTGASSVVFSPDGHLVASGTNGAGGELPEPGEVWIWDTRNGQPRRTIKVAEESEPGEFLSTADLAFTVDGQRVVAAVGSGSRGRPSGLLTPEAAAAIRVWELATGKEVLNLRGHTSSVGRVVSSPDGTRLASAGSDRVVRVWETSTGKEIKAFPFDASRIEALAFSPDSRRLAAGGVGKDRRGEIQVWDCAKD